MWISGVSVCAWKGSKRNQRLSKCAGVGFELSLYKSAVLHTHQAKGFQEPTSGWMSSSQFETSLSWILNVLNGFESFSGWLNWALRSGSLSAVAVQGIIRGGRCLWALPQHQLQRGPASRRRDSLPYTALTFGVPGLNKELRAWNVVTILQTLECYTCAGLK